jgi:hypothetical protein
VRQDNGDKAQVTIRSKRFPARTGHRVTLLIDTEEVLGLINWTTRKRVNYLRTDTRAIDFVLAKNVEKIIPDILERVRSVEGWRYLDVFDINDGILAGIIDSERYRLRSHSYSDCAH